MSVTYGGKTIENPILFWAENLNLLDSSRISAADMILFCFPWFGGGPQFFLQHFFPELVHRKLYVLPVQLPGRMGSDVLFEPTWDEAREKIIAGIKQFIMRKKYAIFAPAIGAWTAFEVVKLLIERGFEAPQHFFVSDMMSPHDQPEEALADLPDEKFFTINCEKYGLENECRKDTVYQDHINASLRCDWKLIESYPAWYQQQVKEGKTKVSSPITVFYPTASKCVTEQQCENWKEHTTGEFKVTKLNGYESMFFFQSDKRRILLEYMMADLQKK